MCRIGWNNVSHLEGAAAHVHNFNPAVHGAPDGGANLDGRGSPGPDCLHFSARAGGRYLQRRRPPNPAVLPAAKPFLSPLLRALAAAGGGGGVPGRAGLQRPSAPRSRRAGVPRHLSGKRPLEPLYPVPGAGCRWSNSVDAPGRHLGPVHRLSSAAHSLFSPERRLETAPLHRNGG